MGKQKALIICLSVISVTILAIFFWFANKKQLNVKTAQSIKTDHPTKHVTITSQPMTISPQIGVPASTNIAELKPIKITPLPKNIQNVIFDQQTGEPSIYITDDHLEFLNKEGKVKARYKLPCPISSIDKKCWSSVQFTKGNKYVGVNIIKSYDSDKETVNSSKFVMLDKDGNEMWERDNKFYSTIPSPNGKYFFGTADPECSGCPIHLVNSSEDLDKSLIWSGYSNDVAGAHVECISEDGSSYVVSILGVYNSKEHKPGNQTAMLLDQNGGILWSYTTELIGPCYIQDGSLIMISRSKNGENISKLDIANIKKVWEKQIFKKGYGVFYLNSFQNILTIGQCVSGDFLNIYEVDISSGAIKKEIHITLLPNEDVHKIEAVSENNDFIIISSYISTPYKPITGKYISLIDFSGNIAKKMYKKVGISDVFLSAAFENNDEYFIVATREGLETYKNPFYKK